MNKKKEMDEQFSLSLFISIM